MQGFNAATDAAGTHSPLRYNFHVSRICIVPAVAGIGGMSSFREKFEAGLGARGISVTHDPSDSASAVLVIAGTKNVLSLWRARRRGVRIVQRLDGINWVHRRRNTGPRHFLRAEYGNFLLSQIRSRLATRLLYQSEFTRSWWEHWYGTRPVPFSVVHNGVDLDVYYPQGPAESPGDRCRLLVVEGNLGGGYDMGLESGIRLAELLADRHGFPMELMVVGKITDAHRAAVQKRARVPIVWTGPVAHERIPAINRSAQLLFSADLNPACPNSVIEALACGLPVVAFDTGALKELVVGDSGRLVPYGGDPWRLEQPDIHALAEAATEILKDHPRFRAAARAHAEAALGLDRMMSGYLKALLEA
jgi:glycosyltransferase involved in cell wall biosynthesis